MLHKFTKMALAPILLVQGRRVRRDTPRLPEAEGAREGAHALQGAAPLRVLIVGDSAAAGVGVQSQEDALMGQLVSRLKGEYALEWKLVARSGWTTGALMRALQKEEDASFDVVVTSLGVNDVLGDKDPKRWRERQLEMIALLKQKFEPRQIILTGIPPMHLFPALPQPLRWFLGQSARRLNRELAEFDAIPDCEVMTVDFPLESDVMASDGFHPGAPGYRVWAEQVADRIRSYEYASEAAQSVG